MKDVNKVIIVGHLGANPVQRYTKTGFPVSHFSVATSRRVYRENPTPSEGETTHVEETQWHQVVAWGKLGEACTQYLSKGSPVYIDGMIRSRVYQDKEGHSKFSFEIHAENVSFLGQNRRPAPQESAPISTEPSTPSFSDEVKSYSDIHF